jgi:ketosteroid isomerase-like protein
MAVMSEREDFLAWIGSDLYAAELALHNGDAGLRKALWSQEEPVSVLGAWRNAFGLREVDALFTHLAESFSDCTSYAFELRALDVVGDVAWTAGFERTSVSVRGEPTSYMLRVTQVYRREDGRWRVAHRHGDAGP